MTLPETNSYLSLLADKNWVWQQTVIEGLVVPPGSSKNLYVDNNIVGYMYEIDLQANNPYLVFNGALYAGGPIREVYDFSDLLLIGQTRAAVLKLLRYDDANQIYFAQYRPSAFPGDPFRGNVSFTVKNPLPATPITIGYFELDILKFKQVS